MKLFAAIGILVGAYAYLLSHTTDLVLDQTAQLQKTYQYVANNSDAIVAGE